MSSRYYASTRSDRLPRGFWAPERVDVMMRIRDGGRLSWREVALVLTSLWGVTITKASVCDVYHRHVAANGKLQSTARSRRYEGQSGPLHAAPMEPRVSRECRRAAGDRSRLSLTGRLMGDPPPGRTQWA